MPTQDEQQELFGAMREINHEHVYELWQAAKRGEPVPADDAQLVQALRDHPEYYKVWDHANEFGHEPMTVGDVNPFMHALMHTVVENQANLGTPRQVRAILEYKTSHGESRHTVVHSIAYELSRGVLRGDDQARPV